MQQSNDPAIATGGKAAATATTKRGASRKRVSISSHREEIVRWVEEGYSDSWIAQSLGTSSSSVQSFRSRAGIRRQTAPASSVDGSEQGDGVGARSTEDVSTTGSTDPGRAAQATVYEGVLDQGEEEGYGLWLDPAVADDPLFQKGFTGVSDIRVVIHRERIVLEPATGSSVEQLAGAEGEGTVDGEDARQLEMITGGTSRPSSSTSGAKGEIEQGKVKWFTREKAYGFILRPGGSQIFFHASELADDIPMNAVSEGRKVSYEVGANKRGPIARTVQLA